MTLMLILFLFRKFVKRHSAAGGPENALFSVLQKTAAAVTALLLVGGLPAKANDPENTKQKILSVVSIDDQKGSTYENTGF